MGILNNVLGINLTDDDPLISNPFNGGASPYSPFTNEDDLLLLESPISKFLLLSGQNLELLSG